MANFSPLKYSIKTLLRITCDICDFISCNKNSEYIIDTFGDYVNTKDYINATNKTDVLPYIYKHMTYSNVFVVKST